MQFCAARDFYPRPPRGGRRGTTPQKGDAHNFYPRPPRGGRRALYLLSYARKIFLSTPSARRATAEVGVHALAKGISIHALREEGDRQPPGWQYGEFDFYPRPPRGGRPDETGRYRRAYRFLSTPSARRATSVGERMSINAGISIHALREEGDQSGAVTIAAVAGFLSTPSARRATFQPSFSPPSSGDFYPRPPRGGRHVVETFQSKVIPFLSTPSARRATKGFQLFSFHR